MVAKDEASNIISTPTLHKTRAPLLHVQSQTSIVSCRNDLARTGHKCVSCTHTWTRSPYKGCFSQACKENNCLLNTRSSLAISSGNMRILKHMLTNFSVSWHWTPHTCGPQHVTFYQRDRRLLCSAEHRVTLKVSGYLSFTSPNWSQCGRKREARVKFDGFPSTPEPKAGLLHKTPTGTPGLAPCPRCRMQKICRLPGCQRQDGLKCPLRHTD